MAGAKSKYSIDASSLIAAWSERYPERHFAPFWKRMETAFESGLALISREVYLELERKEKDLFDWLRRRDIDPVEIDSATIGHVQVIMAAYPKLVDTRTGKSGADPFVIAMAMSWTPKLTVVTEEGRTSNANRPKIPYVCEQPRIGVNYINLLGLIKAEDWRF